MNQDEENSLFFSNDMISDSQDILITNRIAADFLQNQSLKKDLNIKSLWVLGTGTIMTGPFISWNWGVGEAGTLGILVCIIILTFYYLVFTWATSKLSVIYPYIGGPYGYVRQGLGSFGAYCAGLLTCSQFMCCTAAVLAAFNHYLTLINSQYSNLFSLGIFIVLLVIMQLFSTKTLTFMHYCLTCCSLGILIIFLLGTFETIQSTNLFLEAPISINWQEVLRALPFVSVFFLGLENITMAAEEVRFPERSMPKGLYTGFITAAFICCFIVFFTLGSVNWQLLKGREFPLLFTLIQVQSQDKVLISTFTIMSSVGFIAALQGFINGYSRQVYALSRGGYLPLFLSKLHPIRKSYYYAIIVPGGLSLWLSYQMSIKSLIAAAFYSAVIVQVLVLISFVKIRNSEPEFFNTSNRSVNYSLVLYLTVMMLFGILFSCLVECYLFNLELILMFFVSILYYKLWVVKNIRQDAPEEAASALKDRRNKIRFLE